MDTNLIDILKDKIGGRITRDGEDYLDISSDHIDEALDYIFPALLGKLIYKVQNPDDAEDLMEYLDTHGYDGSILQWLEDAFSGGPLTSYIVDVGRKASVYLIGEEKERYLNTISEFTQIDRDKIAHLTSLVAPLFLSQMQNVIKERDYTASNIHKYLNEQKDIAVRQTPSKLFDKLGLQKILSKKEEADSDKTPQDSSSESEGEKNEQSPQLSQVLLKMLPAILALSALIIVFLYVQQYDEKIERGIMEITEDGVEDELFSGHPVLSWGLPNGTEVTATENSVLNELMKYLYGTLPSKKIVEKTFTINQDYVDEKKDTLLPNAIPFTKKLATIMKGYPELEIKFNISIPQHLSQTKTSIGSQFKTQLIANDIKGDRVTWQAGPKQTIGGGDNYKIELVARLPDKSKSTTTE